MPWELPRDQSARLRIAKGYPFEAPKSSYLFVDGKVEPFSDTEKYGVSLSKRKAVIAHGSNRAPEQLKRKFFRHISGQDPIPVTAIWLNDHDVVYSAHVARYGSIAAELIYSPGTEVQVFLTWLTEAQLERMHATELPGGSYSYGHIKSTWVSADRLDLPIDSIGTAVYRSSTGILNYNNNPVAISALPARNRLLADWSQEQALSYVHGTSDLKNLDQAILRSIDSNSYRNQLTDKLKEQSLDVFHPTYAIVE
ncbi:hypothetical protein [Kiloniella antarctica]|uniref:Uncharacterized protein n=1 Tax=Kiloniella antarctica TaxID=1550907 RepID=A0ABW5BHK5_9PROT